MRLVKNVHSPFSSTRRRNNPLLRSAWGPHASSLRAAGQPPRVLEQCRCISSFFFFLAFWVFFAFCWLFCFFGRFACSLGEFPFLCLLFQVPLCPKGKFCLGLSFSLIFFFVPFFVLGFGGDFFFLFSFLGRWWCETLVNMSAEPIPKRNKTA